MTAKIDLVIRLGHLGDVLLTTGVLSYWGRTLGRQFSVVTRPQWAMVYKGNPYVRQVHILENSLGFRSEYSFFLKLAKLYNGGDLIDLHGNLRSCLLRSLWKGKIYTYKKMRLERRLFMLSSKLPWGDFCGERLRAHSVAERYAMALTSEKQHPKELSELSPVVFLSNDELLWGKRQLSLLSGEKPVAIHPYASYAAKTWSRERWIELTTLLNDMGIEWIVMGEGKDIFPPSANNFVNTTSLRQSASLLSACRVLITGDSGPMHLAASVKTPVIALFGPTTREWGFYPTGEKDIIIEPNVMCRPCSLHGKGSCHTPCLESITPRLVLKKIMGQEI